MSTIIYRLSSQTGNECDATVSLQNRVATICMRGLYDVGALMLLVWYIIKRLEIPSGHVPLRVGGSYHYNEEDGRVTCYVKGKPVGWANIGLDTFEGSIECLTWYFIQHMPETDDLWECDNWFPAQEPGYTFDAINDLYRQGACHEGHLLPQFLASPHQRRWFRYLKSAYSAWFQNEPLHDIMMNSVTYQRFIEEMELEQAQKEIDADPETPDWLRTAEPQESTGGAFEDLDLDF